MRTVAALLAGVALSLGSCTAKEQEALKAEFVRETYRVQALTALYVVSVVGSAAPSGGPSALHALGMDVAWRSLAARHFEMSGLAPSPFDAIDPNRPIQFRKTGDNTAGVTIR